MAIELLVVAAITLAAAYLLASNNGDLADKLLFARQVIFGALALAIAIILIGTGAAGLVVLGAIVLFFAWLYLLREKPYEDF